MSTYITGAEEITNGEDILDTRTIEDRIRYLETDHDDCGEVDSSDDRCPDRIEHDELQTLRALRDDYSGGEGWLDGSTLIRDSYFKEYAEDMASEITDYDPRRTSWPFTCIDWDKAADDLKMDYTSVDFDGVEYWTRA